MVSPQSRASLRVIKSPSKSVRQPKIKSAKAAKNIFSYFAAAGVLAVAVVFYWACHYRTWPPALRL